MKRFCYLILALLFISGCRVSTEQLSNGGKANSSVVSSESIAHQESVQAKNTTDERQNADDKSFDRSLMKDARVVEDWEYFLYPLELVSEQDVSYLDNAFVLFRQESNSTAAEQLTTMQCTEYIVRNNNTIYFVDSDFAFDHKYLYRVENSKEPVKIASDIATFQIVEPYIYYSHNFDTVGVGLDGHSLHRIELDGSNHIVAAYGVSALGFGSCIHNFHIKEEFIYLTGTYPNEAGGIKIVLGNPADGTEKIALTSEIDEQYAHLYSDGYLYYGTSKLMKADRNGSSQTVLDAGSEDSWFAVEHIDAEYIYYSDRAYQTYRIRKCGTEKEKIEVLDIPLSVKG